MKKTFLLFFLAHSTCMFAQNNLEWDGKYLLEIRDFQSPLTNIGEVKILANTGIGFAFAFHLSPAESAQEKNFNYRVTNTFNRKEASIEAVDDTWAQYLVNFSRFEWDLSELYARKFRMQLQEAKKPSADFRFVSPIYDGLKAEYDARLEKARMDADLGQLAEVLQRLHREVKDEIDTLPAYCRSCPPVKGKK